MVYFVSSIVVMLAGLVALSLLGLYGKTTALQSYLGSIAVVLVFGFLNGYGMGEWLSSSTAIALGIQAAVGAAAIAAIVPFAGMVISRTPPREYLRAMEDRMVASSERFRVAREGSRRLF